MKGVYEKIADRVLSGASGVQRIPGDASARIYYRVKGSQKSSFIVMKVEPFVEKKFSFLLVQKFLEKKNVAVPKVFFTDPARGCLVLEDLGDTTLLRKLQSSRSVEQERLIYQTVIDILVNLHWKAKAESGQASVPSFKLRFDLTKLMWEVNFAIEHFFIKFLSRKIAPRSQKILASQFRKICSILAKEPTVFTHRDFHSRNVMVKDDKYFMIDFQDARMGPSQYDLASLLRDSYYQLNEKQVDDLVQYYLTSWEAISGKRINREHFCKIFDLMSIQRNFKAIGSFASFQNMKSNPNYLRYIGNTFENIRRALAKYPEYNALKDVLFNYYYF